MGTSGRNIAAEISRAVAAKYQIVPTLNDYNPAPAGGFAPGLLLYETDNLRMLAYDGTDWEQVTGPVPRFRAFTTAAQSIAHQTNTPLVFGGESFDTEGIHSIVTNTERATIPGGFDGVWLFGYSILSPASVATSVAATWLGVNGTGQAGAMQQMSNNAAHGVILSACAPLVLAAGDYVNVIGFQNTGGPVNFNANSASYSFWGYFVGPP